MADHRPSAAHQPLFAHRPVPDPIGPGQESVWDYPRPPRVEASQEHVVVRLGGVVVLDSRRALRVLETSHPPTYYVPITDAAPGALVPIEASTSCEFKGRARLFDVVGGRSIAHAGAWSYPAPREGFEELQGHVALFAGAMDEVMVDGEVVRPQEGDVYGGWITDRVVGPFKGGAGTQGW